MILVGMVLIVVVGGVLIFFGWVEVFCFLIVIGWVFIIFGIFLWYSDCEVEYKGDVGEFVWKDVIVIGVV